MNRIIKTSLAVAAVLCAAAGQPFAQRPNIPLPSGTNTSASGSGTSLGGISGFRTGPRPYKEIITDKARSQRGMVTVHKVDDKYYFELPDSILGKEILAVTRFVKVPWGGGVYGGEEANENVLTFEKGPDNRIFLRVSLNVVESPDSTKPIYQAVKNSSVDPIAAAFDIRAFGRDSMSSIIDVTDFFKGDNQIVSLDAGTKRRFNLSGIAADRSYIETMQTYSKNVEIRSVKTFGASGSSPFALAPSPFPGGSSLPAAQAAGAVTTTINTSLLLLPAKPMVRRAFDPRVGYFADRFTEFNDSSQKVDANTFITRWRLEPKNAADAEKWKRGELIEPQKPIIYYIDPATPKQWRPYLIAGINDWQVAFEKAGFKNAIQGREWPVDDSSMSLEDARFSAIRYFASDIQNAYGPNVHDPRTGEILESHIGWYHNVMNLLHDWYFIQAGAIDPRARGMRFNDSLMGQLVRFVSSHEIGHTLGLRHNMGSSSKTPVELLRNKAWVEAHGHTASIMDYARFNYVAQPEDNIGPAGIYPRIGDYDKWAIMWGYRYSGTDNEEEDKKRSNKLIIDSLKNPRLWFGGEGRDNDPRSQTEDLSDNNVKASEYGIKNLKRIMTNLPAWTKEEGDRYDDLERMYNQVISQYSRYVGHVIKHVGGINETPKSIEQEGDVYAVTPKADQKAAITFLNTNLFETPMWLLNKTLLNKFSDPATTETVQTLQTRTLGQLLSSDRLGRLITSANRDATAYTADEMMTDVQKAVWSELATKKPIDNYRRNLQKSYVETLIGLLPGAAPTPSGFVIVLGGGGGFSSVDPRRSDVSSIARGQLTALNTQVKAALPATTDKMSRYHLQDVLARIDNALNPR